MNDAASRSQGAQVGARPVELVRVDLESGPDVHLGSTRTTAALELCDFESSIERAADVCYCAKAEVD